MKYLGEVQQLRDGVRERRPPFIEGAQQQRAVLPVGKPLFRLFRQIRLLLRVRAADAEIRRPDAVINIGVVPSISWIDSVTPG